MNKIQPRKQAVTYGKIRAVGGKQFNNYDDGFDNNSSGDSLGGGVDSVSGDAESGR